MLTSSIIANYQIKPLLSFDGDGTIKQIARIVEVDATNNDITITLGEITNNTIRNFPMVIKRIDGSLNTVTIIGTSGNFPEDDPLTLLIFEGFTVYASDDLKWRSTD